MIGERTCSLKEIMGMMELKNRENFLDNYLNPSIEAGLVEPKRKIKRLRGLV